MGALLHPHRRSPGLLPALLACSTCAYRLFCAVVLLCTAQLLAQGLVSNRRSQRWVRAGAARIDDFALHQRFCQQRRLLAGRWALHLHPDDLTSGASRLISSPPASDPYCRVRPPSPERSLPGIRLLIHPITRLVDSTRSLELELDLERCTPHQSSRAEQPPTPHHQSP
ncbi:hypothetical protein TARUN_7173 [Trichoderma arundinaceum]|uniref:Uncharacterized protein n=1 Tax=Trichoderma arundinaceum TaxID=490622 RepID=A0A395NGJ1_TRIAR|nr:hypothetical protein TARUN_7173 [Trichoderma arundinaceum]